MRVAVKDFHGQARSIATALAGAGHELNQDGPTDLFLVDLDPDAFGYRNTIDFYSDLGAVVLQYPHGAGGVNLSYDGLYEPYERVDGELTPSPGVAEVYARMDIARPVREIGWYHCRPLPFRPCPNVRRVTFAPIHPNADGAMLAPYKEGNTRVYKRLLEGPWELTVRHIGTPEMSGLWLDDRVRRWVEGDRDMSTVEIDLADAVVTSPGSYANLAVARGAPTVLYAQEAPSNYGLPGEQPVPRTKWPLYADLVRYPYDIDDGPLENVIRAAALREATDWRRRWIGEAFRADRAAEVVERFVAEITEKRREREPLTSR